MESRLPKTALNFQLSSIITGFLLATETGCCCCVCNHGGVEVTSSGTIRFPFSLGAAQVEDMFQVVGLQLHNQSQSSQKVCRNVILAL